MDGVTDIGIRAVETMYVEVLLLSDDARLVFERALEHEPAPARAIKMSVERIRVTTRLMHVAAWLIARRAIARGEDDDRHRAPLAGMPESDGDAIAGMPDEVRLVIQASIDIATDARALEQAFLGEERRHPVQGMLGRLAESGYGVPGD